MTGDGLPVRREAEATELGAFLDELAVAANETNAQSGKGLTPAQAGEIVTAATAIRQSLGC